MAKNPVSDSDNPKVRKIDAGIPGSSLPEFRAGGLPGGTTGRYLVLLREDATDEGLKALRKTTGRSIASAAEVFSVSTAEAAKAAPEAIVYETLGVAVVDSPPEQMQSMAAEAGTESSPILLVEAERYVYAFSAAPSLPFLPEEEIGGQALPSMASPLEYLIGYRDAVNHVVARVIDRAGAAEEMVAGLVVPAAWNETQFTWGLQATLVPQSRFSGKGIRVAVLDTGMDLGHPDFAGRNVTGQSFVPGQAVQDGHGHGTHCIGTSCGPRNPGKQPRYGVAFAADIFAGKVLSNQGSGSDGQILAGIDWAIRNKCAVVSMSLGAPTQPGQPFSQVFEQVATRALKAGTLIVAAAGNESQRPQHIAPVGHPANCPSIMAVAALDQRIRVAPFSCGGLNPNGGQVDIAAPGVAVRSSWPRPALYNTISGTSMATPHVAGIAALFAESQPHARGLGLWALVIQHARHLAIPPRDAGKGITQAP
jgi:subtilisin family serine protease